MDNRGQGVPALLAIVAVILVVLVVADPFVHVEPLCPSSEGPLADVWWMFWC